ncbi:MAG TPA: histidine phosphatase family protein [Paraburkholderia sp.]|jgi:broad specificity phosphatase PhoE
MPTTVWLVSHAADAALRSGTFPRAREAGDAEDETLDARAIEALAGWRTRWYARVSDADSKAPRVLTSPAPIALASAHTAGFNGATPDDALADTDYGAWQGKRLTDLARESPETAEALTAWTRDPCFRPPAGGESFEEVRERVSAWLDALPESGLSVVAFTHASVIRAAILHALGAPSSGFRSIDIAPLSVTALRRAQHGWVWLAAVD